MNQYDALPGLYGIVFLTMEPMALLLPGLLTALVPGGGTWFYNQLVPGGPPQNLDSPHVRMVLGQAVNGK